MGIRVYSHTDVGAPTLTTNVPGKLAELFKAVFADGYGSQPAMGWDFNWDTSTNQRFAMRSADITSTRMWFYMDDTGTIGAGGNSWARAWAAEDFTGWDAVTGDPNLTDKVPTDTQSSFGLTYAKHVAVNSTAVPWIIIASDKSFYLFVCYYDPSKDFTDDSCRSSVHFFGDIITRKSADLFNCLISGGSQENYTSVLVGSIWSLFNTNYSSYLLRNYDSTQKSVPSRLPSAGWDLPVSGLAGAPYPDPVSGQTLLYTVPIEDEADYYWRGYLPGVLGIAHDISLSWPDFTHLSSINHGGNTYQLVRLAVFSNSVGGVYIQTSGDWYA